MKAQDARSLAIYAVDTEIAYIKKLIKELARTGHTQLNVSKISQGAKAYFEDEGYKIQECTRMDSCWTIYTQTTIKW